MNAIAASGTSTRPEFDSSDNKHVLPAAGQWGYKGKGKRSASTIAGFDKLPLETIAHIAQLARENDIKVRVEGKAAGVQGKGVAAVAGFSRGHARKKSQFWRADSALCLARTCRTVAAVTLPVVWRSLDFTDVPVHQHAYIAGLLEDGRGAQVRQLQLTVALVAVPGGQLHDSKAVSVEMAARILRALPLLDWLEVELVSLNSTHYVSQLPNSLAAALAQHTSLKHFGISCQGQTNDVVFQLDERLVARLVAGFPRLTSLTLHRIGHDLLLKQSPLFDAIAALRELHKLNVLEVQALDDTWTRVPLGGSLQSLTLVCCHRLSPSALDGILCQNKNTLSTLSLVHTPNRDHPALSHAVIRTKYDLPALRTLYIEAEQSHVDNIDFIRRFTKTRLGQLSIRYARGITAGQMEELLGTKQLKALKKVEVGRFGLASMSDDKLDALTKVAGRAGVELVIGGKSSLAPEAVH